MRASVSLGLGLLRLVVISPAVVFLAIVQKPSNLCRLCGFVLERSVFDRRTWTKILKQVAFVVLVYFA
jgi:hypothetical protein